MLFNEHYVILIYAMKLLFKYAMKLLMWGKDAFNRECWYQRRPNR